MKKTRSLTFLLLLMVVVILLWQVGNPLKNEIITISHSQFIELLNTGKIESMEYDGDAIYGKKKGENVNYETVFPEEHLRNPEYTSKLEQSFLEKGGDPKKISVRTRNVLLYNVLLPLIPWLIIFFVAWWLISRQLRATAGPGSILSFGKTRAKQPMDPKKKVTFSDVAGINEAKEEVQEIIEFLKNPQKFQKLGGRMPRGILLVGPPGTGKTLLAKAIAGEANVPFFSISGSDFVEMFVGVGASRVRDLFKQAKDNSPCIVFLDEIDAVGRRRGSGLGGGHDEREQTLNAILVEMDGFNTDDGVIVLAATNRPDILDPALLRPGRFDREVVIDMPDVKGREEILKVHAKKIKLIKDIDLKVLARTTPTFSGADLEALINEAALRAVMKNKPLVDLEELEEARDKVKWGRQKRSRVMEEEDRKVTAYHESGHALVSKLIPGMEPIHKVTIIPRGMALGATMRLPEKDRYHMHKNYLLGNITVLFAGRAAEEIACNDISAGARNDIKEATELARLMVTEWGMSDALGMINYSDSEEHMFLGREIAKTRSHSESTSEIIDTEIKKIVDHCYTLAKQYVSAHKQELENITAALLKYEVLSGTDIDRIFQGVPLAELRKNNNGVASSE
ncbi:MAG: ATP-dependent metallopeptidase FtsH/Yme1/Tma family protein [Planctomycetes bacterium]|nr:ATP-dependent metallopeptidase FtsH/Yme1/Tma family protein [Planctomycetota bacterium]